MRHKELVKRLKRGDGVNIEKYVGNLIGYGADGCVYEYTTTRVIKICWAGDQENFEYFGYKKVYIHLSKIINKINGISGLVKIYKHGELKRGEELGYYMIMEKLNKLSELEKNKLGDVCKLGIGKGRWVGCGRKCSCIACSTELISKGIKRAKELSGKYHKDLHKGNIMKDRVGRLKIIDMEGFLYK